MFSPFTITVKLTVDVSDSHELQDKLAELSTKYPDSVVEYAPKRYEGQEPSIPVVYVPPVPTKNKRGTRVRAKTGGKVRTGPKLRYRYCAYCGTKCEGARVAKGHCKKVGTVVT